MVGIGHRIMLNATKSGVEKSQSQQTDSFMSIAEQYLSKVCKH